jgi:hypothetical protein
VSVLLNFGFLAVWFVCLWLLMRFQWSHALGLAVVFWLVMLLFIMPMVLRKAEEVRKERLPPKTQAPEAIRSPEILFLSQARCGDSYRPECGRGVRGVATITSRCSSWIA